jgi:hypothetical protein
VMPVVAATFVVPSSSLEPHPAVAATLNAAAVPAAATPILRLGLSTRMRIIIIE